MEVYRALDGWAPFETQMDFDNAGFLVGRGERPVSRVLVALDITEQVVEESGLWGAQLVVSHHPVIFHPVKTITDASPLGRTLLRLAELGIAAICAHTNLDAAQGGVNDVLAHRLALVDTAMLHQDGTDCQGRPYGIGRVGRAHQEGLEEIAGKFGLIAKIEQLHARRFNLFLDYLKKDQLYLSEQETGWTCLNCGFMVTSTAAPKECPVCGHPRGWFCRVELAPYQKNSR